MQVVKGYEVLGGVFGVLGIALGLWIGLVFVWEWTEVFLSSINWDFFTICSSPLGYHELKTKEEKD